MTSLSGSRAGQKLGNYRLRYLIGQGGFAEVYLGEHIYLKTQAAVKVLHTQLAREDQESFLTEARTIARLKHPNILPVLEFGVEDGIPFLVMDHAPNGSLRTHYPQGHLFTPVAVLPHFKQVAAALHYAHQEHIIHRDIKPENMLLGAQGEVLLSDFGLSLGTRSSRTQSMDDVAGTIAYMAPELLQGRPSPASDQYALGIVLYEWLSGHKPFRGTFTEIASQQVLAPPPAIKSPSVSPEVEAVIAQALAKAPEQRFESVQAFATAFEQATLEVGETFRAGTGWHPQFTIQQQNLASAAQTALMVEQQATVRGISGPTQEQLPTTPPAVQIVPPQKMARRKDPSGRIVIALAALALLVATSSLALAFYLIGSNAGWLGGPSAQQQATTQAQATLTAFQNKYKQATSGKPFLDDPLNQNVNSWFTFTNPELTCEFTGGAYHISVTHRYLPGWCSSGVADDAASSLSNLAYQIQMTIVKGNEGGIIFHLGLTADKKSWTGYYSFSLNRSGTYTLMRMKYPLYAKTLLHGQSNAIKRGLQQANLLTVIVQGKQIELYINKQYIGSSIDDMFKTGSIGVLAIKSPDDTEVAFNNAQVWKL